MTVLQRSELGHPSAGVVLNCGCAQVHPPTSAGQFPCMVIKPVGQWEMLTFEETMTSVALVTGPTSAFNLALACRPSADLPRPSVVLILSGNMPDDDPFLQLTAGVVELLVGESIVRRWNGDPAALSTALPIGVDHIWICRPFMPYEKILALTFPQAAISLFDEGIGSLAARAIGPVVEDNMAADTLWRREIPVNILSRAISATSTLDGWGLPPQLANCHGSFVSRELTIATLEKAQEHFQWPEPQATDVLVSGTSFHNVHWGSDGREARHYARLIQRLLADGRNVLWTEHPRVRTSLLNDASFEGLKEHDRFRRWPAPPGAFSEIIALRAPPRLSISIGSSTQATLFEWFNVPAEITVDENLDRLPDDFPQIGLLRSRFPTTRI
jgi:hypothetical protein